MDLKKELKHLQILMIEYNSVNMCKDDLEIVVDEEAIKNETLRKQNEMFQEQITKVKKAQKHLSINTALYYLSNIVLVITTLIGKLYLNNIFYVIGSFSCLAFIYLFAICSDARLLSKNDIRFYKKIIKKNNDEIDENDEIIRELNNNLRDLIKRSYA